VYPDAGCVGCDHAAEKDPGVKIMAAYEICEDCGHPMSYHHSLYIGTRYIGDTCDVCQVKNPDFGCA
jgi:hypothetical protein